MIPPYKGPAMLKEVTIETGNASEYQLYNLKDDPSQKNNMAKSKPAKLKELIAAYEIIRGTQNTPIQQIKLK